MTDVAEPDVLVVGAGPAGLTVAIELGRRGHRVLLVERTPRGGYKAPRTYLINNRTMEQLRRWGLADTLRSRNPIDPAMKPDVVFATSLTGQEIHTFHRAFVGTAREETSSENAEWTPQATIEGVLTEHLESFPNVIVRWNSEIVSFVDAGDHVLTTVRDVDTAAEITIKSKYLVGADGSRSVVRHGLDIRLEGTANLMKAFIYHVRAPELKALITVPKASFYWFVNGSFNSYSGVILNTMSAQGDYSFGCFPSPPDIDPDNEDDVRKVFYGAVGDEVPVEFVSGRSWNMHALLAPRYGQGRVFIAGDAAHLIPNLGGFGFNLSVLDAVDLGWKLSAVLSGWGGEHLLDSYSFERHQADTWVTQVQIENAAVLSHHMYRPGMESDDETGAALRGQVAEVIAREKNQEFQSLGAQKGYRYIDSPIVVDDGSAPAPRDPVTYVQTSRPGALAPHAWLADGSSLYDHFGQEFTVLVAPGADPADFVTEARASNVPLTVYEVPAQLAALYPQRFTLVRPDQHVCWRGDEISDGVTAILGVVTGRRVPAPIG